MSIRLRGLTRRFGEKTVIEPLSLEIQAGEFVSILGPSGCGKSTLLRIIAGLDQASDGELHLDPELMERGRRAFVFQEAHLLPWRTALQNVTTPLELLRVPKSELVLRAREALGRVGLLDAAGLYPHQLSGGMKMRVSLARALVTRPRLLLLDEPFAALDESTRHELQEDLRLLWKNLEMTVIFVTHSVSEAVFLSTRALVLSARPAHLLSDQAIRFAADGADGAGAGRSFNTRTSADFNARLQAIHETMHAGRGPR